jgi:hypothetical protein
VEESNKIPSPTTTMSRGGGAMPSTSTIESEPMIRAPLINEPVARESKPAPREMPLREDDAAVLESADSRSEDSSMLSHDPEEDDAEPDWLLENLGD